MITYVKDSKLNKVDTNFFNIIRISMEKSSDEDMAFMPYLLPPASLMLSRNQGNIGKKKFKKEYMKYLKTNKGAEPSIFNICRALDAKRSLCFTCTDDEFELGYLKILGEYISDVLGVDVVSLKEAKESIKYELDNLEKKSIKLLKKSDDELSGKKAKAKKKIIKNINKLISSEMSQDGEEYMELLDKRYAVEQILYSSVEMGICSFNNNKISDINESKIKKSSPFVRAIMLTAKNDKTYKKIIKSVVEANSLELKNKALKKLSKTQIVSLCGEIVKKIAEYREHEFEQ